MKAVIRPLRLELVEVHREFIAKLISHGCRCATLTVPQNQPAGDYSLVIYTDAVGSQPAFTVGGVSWHVSDSVLAAVDPCTVLDCTSKAVPSAAPAAARSISAPAPTQAPDTSSPTLASVATPHTQGSRQSPPWLLPTSLAGAAAIALLLVGIRVRQVLLKNASYRRLAGRK